MTVGKPPSPLPRSAWRRAGWFVALWLGGVLVTIVIAAVFKLLMLGAVKL